MAKDVNRFVRRQNIERYKRLLENSSNEDRRKYLEKLIAAEKQKQKNAGDSKYLY